MFHPDTLHYLARERQREALQAASDSHRHRLRLARDPLFNHYHFWPAEETHRQLEAALEVERARWELRGGGWLEGLARAVGRGARGAWARLARDGNPGGGATALTYVRRP